METTITATELARHLSDILNRVRYKGESFRVERNGEVVAMLKPEKRTITWGEFAERWDKLPRPDPDFWKDLEAAHREMNQPPPTPLWEDAQATAATEP